MFKILCLFLFVACSALGEEQKSSASTRIGNLNRYILCTRSNRNGEDITSDPLKVDPGRNLTVLVHGHEGSAASTFNTFTRDEILMNKPDIDVLIVDWVIYASLPYVSAAAAAPSVGQGLADFIRRIDDDILNNLHLVGFGLGAHVVGVTGRNLDGKVARITGLDPTGANFDSNSQRLRSTDAKYVEVIHTDTTGALAVGTSDLLGHVDFFPNGGKAQPGCSGNACNHARAYELFSSTVHFDNHVGNLCYTTTQLTTNACTSFALKMGNTDLDKIGSGIFRLTTGRTYPFNV